MSGALTATFFGGFEVRRDGELVSGFPYDKLKALFAYLAIEPAFPFNRDVLAGMFWPEQSESNARHSLRQAISHLRSILEVEGESALILADRTTIQRNPGSDLGCDVYRFSNALKQADQAEPSQLDCLELAASIYRGELLKGLSLAQTEQFEDWLLSRRESFHRQIVTALEKIAKQYERQLDYVQVRRVAEKWVELEPWREEAHRLLMLALARNGQRTAALKQYQLCCQAVTHEFGLQPDRETDGLHRRILSMDAPRSSIPVWPTPLIGRHSEMKSLAELLANPKVRLVTITGPGGTGKTRLAIQAGNRVSESGSRAYLNGVAFVPLDGLSSPDGIPSSIAQAISFSFHKSASPLDQLLQHLRDKEMLLILDNLEHLLGKETAKLVQRLLDGARDVKILATSRQKLSLRSETILPLSGLATPVLNHRPSKTPLRELPASGAIKLFITLLARSRGDMQLSEQELSSVVHICQLVEGLPLAIELAVALASDYSLQEISLSIEESLEFLRADIYDLPDRHRSIHAAIDASWGLLEEQERSSFKRLSLFRGGFTYHAAQEVSGSTRETLSSLANKSFIRYDTRSSRFEIHELLRQYGSEKLASDPLDLARVREKHVQYYSSYILSSHASFFTPRELEALKNIEVEYHNILAAWSWAVEQEPALLARQASPLHHFYLRRARFHEGIQAFQLGIDRLASKGPSQPSLHLAWLQAYQGDLYAQAVDLPTGLGLLKAGLEKANTSMPDDGQVRQLRAFCLSRLGVYAQQEGESQAYLEESLRLYRELEDKAQVSYVLAHLGDLHRTFGKLDRSLSALQESLAIQQELGADLDKVKTLKIISLYAMRRGDLENIESPLLEGVQIARAGGDLNQLAIILETSGIGYSFLGKFIQAEQAMQESMDIRHEIDQRNNLVVNYYLMSLIKLHQGYFSEAKIFAQRSLQLADELDDPSSNGNGYFFLGGVALAAGSYEESRRYYENSIAVFRTGWQQDWQSRQGFAYAQLAILDCRQGYLELARSHLQAAFARIQENQSYIGLTNLFPAMSLYLIYLERLELGLEIYARVMREPFPSNSAWFKVAAGQEIEKAVKSLDPHKALQYRQAGEARDLWQTARQISKELDRVGALESDIYGDRNA
jgi:predicted ATPase/DNA-binding SARP family transcriptional activator